MKSKTTARFRELYDALPTDGQQQARAACRLFKQNPRQGSLQFKRVSAKDPLSILLVLAHTTAPSVALWMTQ